MTILAGFAVNLTAFSSIFDVFLAFLGVPKNDSKKRQKSRRFFCVMAKNAGTDRRKRFFEIEKDYSGGLNLLYSIFFYRIKKFGKKNNFFFTKKQIFFELKKLFSQKFCVKNFWVISTSAMKFERTCRDSRFNTSRNRNHWTSAKFVRILKATDLSSTNNSISFLLTKYIGKIFSLLNIIICYIY